MKTFFMLLMCCTTAIVATFVSCSKTGNPSPQTIATPKLNKEGINGNAERMAIVALDTRSEQIIAFNAKSDAVKAAIWDDKLVTAINSGGLSATQITMLEDLRDQLTPDLWVENSTARETYLNSFHDTWVSNALGAFDENLLGHIVGSLEDIGNPSAPYNSDEGDCECSVKSDWCDLGRTCKSHNCNSLAHGCGTMWIYKCVGVCQF